MSVWNFRDKWNFNKKCKQFMSALLFRTCLNTFHPCLYFSLSKHVYLFIYLYVCTYMYTYIHTWFWQHWLMLSVKTIINKCFSFLQIILKGLLHVLWNCKNMTFFFFWLPSRLTSLTTQLQLNHRIIKCFRLERTLKII